ncbi:hypothetical protein [Flavobacterium psychrophilum]|uniref:hypothetical protein n=1 Tax=Flavobacterium psychrophilum TaxID=96345 RepID=UPI000B7C1343|nr:hypothetical protein [Flavobacterium psychrophilum]SNB35445.1 hypothetical protein NO098_200004 [Flavobacterium psychrophilum]
MNYIITKITDKIDCLKDDMFLEKQSKKLTKNHKFSFRMFDDDGDFYYEGLSKINFTFEPLDDFGKNAGCTEIHFLENNKYTRL